jgi:RNA polymerase sigma factor (TIGR02999 family)
MSDVTHILNQIHSGDPSAAEQLLPLVYGELRKLAAAKLAQEPSGQTLQPTDLVHEAYLRLIGNDSEFATISWNGQGHFFAAAAEAMRRILVERARYRLTLKAGGGRQKLGLTDHEPNAKHEDQEIVDLNEALERLAAQQPSIAQLVKLKYFAGLTMDQTAACLGISPRTAHRQWIYAKAWLRKELQ